MYQWRLMKTDSEIEYGKRMASHMNLQFIRDIDLKSLDLGHPAIHISNDDELYINLDMKLNEAILRLKQDNSKSFFQFNDLMYCKLYPRYMGNQDVIVVMDLYWANIMT